MILQLYSKYVNILNKLNIPDYKNVAKNLFTKYGYNYEINYSDLIHHGGGKDYVILKHDDTKFKLYKTTDDNTISYALHKNNDESELPHCIFMQVDKKEKYVSIADLTYSLECFSEDYKNKIKKDTGFQVKGGKLVEIALVAINLIKKKYDLKHIFLLDQSEKMYKDENHIVFNLSLLYTFFTGDTWYGKWGFRPVDRKTTGIDKELILDYEKNKNIMTTTRVRDCKTLKIHIENALKNVCNNNIKKIVIKSNDKKEDIELKKRKIAEYKKIYTTANDYATQVIKKTKILNYLNS